jgi:hypothetical protein
VRLGAGGGVPLAFERGGFSSHCHPALAFLVEHDRSESRFQLFDIVLKQLGKRGEQECWSNHT